MGIDVNVQFEHDNPVKLGKIGRFSRKGQFIHNNFLHLGKERIVSSLGQLEQDKEINLSRLGMHFISGHLLQSR